MSQLEPPTTASFSFAHSGNVASFLNATSTGHVAKSDDPWIIDSRASNHMTGSSSLFTSSNLCSGKEKVKIADGSLSSVSSKGSILVTTSMSLSSLLNVPNLANNLLSIAWITADLNCQVIFYSSYYFVQDVVTGKMIGNSSLKEGLYFLGSHLKQTGWLKHAYHITQTHDSIAINWL